MKKSFKFFAAALAIVAAASCAKEQTPEEVNAPASINGEYTFTASIASDTKLGIDAEGKCTWSVGDYVMVYNGNNSEYVVYDYKTPCVSFNSGNIQTITVTAEMLSADAKTLKIKTTLDAPTAGKWYFYAVNLPGNVYRINADGSAICGSISETSQSTIPFTASASCATGASTVKFKHSVAYLKMSASAWLYKVTVASNNSDAILKAYNLYPSDGHTAVRADSKTNEYVASVNGVAVNAPFYVALTPFTWASGITLGIYYGSSYSADWSAKTPTKTVATSKSFTAVAGHVYNMGDILADHTPKTTYYEMWEAGQDITIGGVKYNKASSGLTAMHITANTTLTDGSSAYWKKILFVDEGVTVTAGSTGSFRMDNTVIVGNKVGTRSTFVLKSKGWMSAQNTSKTTEMFKNMIIKPDGYTGDYIMWNRYGIKRFVIDDCFLDFSTVDGTASGFSGQWRSTNDYDEITIVDSEIKCRTDNNKLFFYSGVGSLTLKNNIFYAPEGENHMISEMFQCGARTDSKTVGNTVIDIQNNTFINLRGNGNLPAVVCQNYEGATIKGNLLIYTHGEGLPNNLFILGNSNKTTLDKPTMVVSNNYIYDVATSTTNAFIGHWSYYVSGGSSTSQQSDWIRRNTATYGLASNPYTTMDLANGTFANSTSYGATR